MERPDLTELFAELVKALATMGLVDLGELVKRISAGDALIVSAKNGKVDYREIAQVLPKTPVFIPGNRKKAYYATRRLEKMLGKKVAKKKAYYGSMEGFIFYIPGETPF